MRKLKRSFLPAGNIALQSSKISRQAHLQARRNCLHSTKQAKTKMLRARQRLLMHCLNNLSKVTKTFWFYLRFCDNQKNQLPLYLKTLQNLILYDRHTNMDRIVLAYFTRIA